MFWFFGYEACGILAPPPEIEPILPELEGRVLTIGPPGKSQEFSLNRLFIALVFKSFPSFLVIMTLKLYT